LHKYSKKLEIVSAVGDTVGTTVLKILNSKFDKEKSLNKPLIVIGIVLFVVVSISILVGLESEVFIDVDICKEEPICYSASVTKIIDGDTIDVRHLSTGESLRIRLSLIDTQERGDELFEAAKDFTANLCPVNSRIIFDQDDGQTELTYGRVIGLVFCSGNLLNEELLETNLAVIDSRFCDESEYRNDEWAQRYGC